MPRLLVPLCAVTAFLLVACDGDEPQKPPAATATTDVTATAPAGTDAPPDAPAATPTAPGAAAPTATSGTAVCLEADAWAADGDVDVAGVDAAGEGDAAAVGALRWAAHDGCERFVIDLATEDGGEAATPGDVAAEFLRDLGVVRVHLPGVTRANEGATDATFDGELATAAYVVLAPEGGGVFVDVHAGSPAEASVSVLGGPARVVVDLRPGGGEVAERAARAGLVVVLEPRPGEASYPLTVAGYARTFEANVIVRIEQGGEQAYEDFTTSTGWLEAWGYYEFTIAEGPSGDIALQVGEYSARDGAWQGSAVDLTMR